MPVMRMFSDDVLQANKTILLNTSLDAYMDFVPSSIVVGALIEPDGTPDRFFEGFVQSAALFDRPMSSFEIAGLSNLLTTINATAAHANLVPSFDNTLVNTLWLSTGPTQPQCPPPGIVSSL
jgi:hypothetical protein